MPFWNSDKIWTVHEALQAGGGYLVEGLTPDAIQHAACELKLGNEAFVTSTKHRLKYQLEENEQVEIPPGQFAALLTKERVKIPRNTLAFISIKTGIKARGLVNVSGFHVDPGFSGRLVFSVYNAGAESVILTKGASLFPIWFADLADPVNDPFRPQKGEDPKSYDQKKGAHWEQKTISDDVVMNMLGDVASPATLKGEIDSLRATVNNLKVVTAAILVAVLSALIKWIIEH